MKTYVALLVLFCSPLFSKADCSFTSTGLSSNYTVSVSLFPYNVTKTCNGGGYTFQVNIAYSITLSAGAPGLYTLQGTVNCNNLPGSSSIYFPLPLGGGNGIAVSSTSSSSKTDCATASPQTLGCNTISLTINGPGISSRTVNCPIASLLPVQIIDFTAINNNGNVEAKWTTASETNNSYFTLEKSKNGADFLAVTKILPTGNSNALQYYSAIDTTPFEGVSYYRVKQTDADGQTSYTRLETIKMDVNSLRWSIYPNPNSSNQLHFSGLTGSKYLEVVSATGKKVFATELKTNEITLPNLAKGMYHLKLTDKNDNSSRVVKYVRL